MSIFAQLECMEADGAITDTQKAALLNTVKSLPTTEKDLLALIAAAVLNPSDNAYGEPASVESLMSTDTADVKALTVPDGATKALIGVHGNNIICRFDGENPAANVGHPAAIGTNFMINDPANFRFISESTTDAYVFVSYY